MTSVRPVAVAPSDAPSARQSRGSADLFAGLLEVAGGEPTDSVRDSSERRPSSQQRAHQNAGCVVRSRRTEDSPVRRAEEKSGIDPATGTPDEPPTRPTADPATVAATPPVVGVEASLNAGIAAGWIALPADGLGAPPTGSTPSLRPILQPNSQPGVDAKTRLDVQPGTSLGSLTGPPGAPAPVPGAVVAGAVAALGTAPVGSSDQAPGADLTAKAGQEHTTAAVTTGEVPADAGSEPTDAAAGPQDAAPDGAAPDPAADPAADPAPEPAPEPAPTTAGTADLGGQHKESGHGAGHRDGGHEPSDDRTSRAEAPGRAVPPGDSLIAGTPDPAGSAQPGAAAASAPAATPAPSPSGSGAPTVLGAGPATGSPGSPPHAGTPAAAAASSVTGQVIPEIARLVTRADGTQRVTVKLAPEALGEVRIVLTVRRGEVHVRMTGSEAAQQALLSGQSDLHRLLAGAGATSSSVQVGDQAATQASVVDGSADSSPGGSLANAPDHGPGSRDHRPEHGTDGRHGRAGADVPRNASGRDSSGPAAPNPSRRPPGRLDVSV